MAAFGVSRVDTACRNFDLHITNPTRTVMLDIDVDAEALGLKAGSNTVSVTGHGSKVQLEVVEFSTQLTGERDCTDLESSNDPGISRRWVATGGELVVTLTADPAEGQDNTLGLELRAVRFEDGAGGVRVVNGRFSGMGIGWLPG